MSTEHLADDVIGLLMQLIEIPSFSGEESQTADCIQNWLHSKGVETQRIQNNVFAFSFLLLSDSSAKTEHHLTKRQCTQN